MSERPNHADFDIYRLSYRRVDQTTFTEILESRTAVTDGELGVWDTSLLLNDEYVIRLEVATTEGVANVVERNVGLAGELKLGNFQLQFTDMVIPVAGIPIEITRVYDTLQADREGDFGFGWRLEFRDTDLRVGLPTSGLEDIGIFPALRPGVKVYLNVPGQGRQGFTFNPDIRVLPGFGGENLVLARPRFTPDPGVTSTLATGTSGYLQVNELGELYAPGGIPYNPASPDFGGAYVLTTREGITYRIDGASGKLDTATDRNGNQVRFDDSGIRSDNGISVIISRNSSGAIVTITDPLGNSMGYEYANQRLVAAVDREGNRTTYSYTPGESPILDEVNDPLGRGGIRAEYDSQGRLIENIDLATGASVVFRQQLEDGRTRIERSDGSVEILSYDNRGRVVQRQDQDGRISTYEHGEFGVTRLVDPLGRVTRFEYDSLGRRTTIILPGDIITRFAYDAEGNLINSVDALGQVVELAYDNQGNLIMQSDGDRTSTYEYDAQGQLIRQTDSVVGVREFERDAAGYITVEASPGGRVVAYERDALGNSIREQLTILDSSGSEIQLLQQNQYDANGFLSETTDANGGVLEKRHDHQGLPTSITDQLGRTSELSYLNGQVESYEFSDGTTVEYAYDQGGRVTAATDRSGLTTHFVYDLRGNLIERILPDQTPQDLSDNDRFSYTYDLLNRQISVTDPNGATTRFEYDLAGNVVLLIDAAGNPTQFFRNALGQVERMVDREGQSMVFEYDRQGNQISRIEADGSTHRTEYDAAGRIIEQTDARGKRWRYEWNAANQLIAVVSPNDSRHLYEYDVRGNLVAEVDANGNRRLYEFDSISRPVASERSDGSRTSQTFTPDSRPQTRTDGRGVTTSFTYDNALNIQQVNYGDAFQHSFDFDDRGNLLTVQDQTGTILQEFDSQNQLVRRIDGSGNEVRYEYDENGNRTAIISSSGTTEYFYDAQDRVVRIVETPTSTTPSTYLFEYGPEGRNTRTEFPDGSVESRLYDVNGRVATIEVKDAGNSAISRFDYLYYANGQVRSVTEIDGTVTEYTYDDLGQIATAVRTKAGVSISVTEYFYDDVGNIVREINDGVETVRTYSPDNQLQTEQIGGVTRQYAYDGAGNLIRVEEDGAPIQTYEWDNAGRLVRSVIQQDVEITTEYVYDWSGLLVSKTVNGETTEFIYDRSKRLPVIIAATRNGQTERFVHADRPLSNSSDTTTRHFLLDASNSVRGLAGSGTAEGLRHYSPYGVTVAEGGLNDEPLVSLGFSGEMTDEATGNIFLRQRYYSPSQGRFISVDPYEGLPSLPLSRHDYQYAYNDPVNGSDPSGELSDYTIVSLKVAASILGTIAVLGGIQYLVSIGGYGQIEWAGVQVGFVAEAGVEVSASADVLTTLATSLESYEGGPEGNEGYRIATGPTVSIGAGFGAVLVAGANAGGISLTLRRNTVTRGLGGAALSGAYILGESGGGAGVGAAWAPVLVMGHAHGNASGLTVGTIVGGSAGGKAGVSAIGSIIGDESDKNLIASLADSLALPDIKQKVDDLISRYV